VSFATIDSLRESLAAPQRTVHSPEYARKMLHDVPDAEVVDRSAFVLARCKGKHVLHVGASGRLHEEMLKVAGKVAGIDREGNGKEIVGWDLDDVETDPFLVVEYDLIVCGEVLEHLGNPLHFLKRLREAYPRTPVIVTVPNAFASAGRKHMTEGVENVNIDHVAWYSYRTLKTLVERAGYAVAEFHWYAPGEPGFSEGLIFVLGESP
jgi:hypothetical protein